MRGEYKRQRRLKKLGSAELDEFVERVSERTDIYSVVSRYVTLKQKGGRYWGCCPFHSEKTPSFTISPDKGFFAVELNFLPKMQNSSLFFHTSHL